VGEDLSGFRVEAPDGDVGAVDPAASDSEGGFLVLDPDPRFFAKKLVVPADAVASVDVDARTVRVSWTKEQLKDAAQFEDEPHEAPTDVTPYYDHELDPFSDPS
jgi:hypothetical protein